MASFHLEHDLSNVEGLARGANIALSSKGHAILIHSPAVKCWSRDFQVQLHTFALCQTDESNPLIPPGINSRVYMYMCMHAYMYSHQRSKAPWVQRHHWYKMQALVRERMNDWGKGLCTRLGKKMVELTGDFTPDLRALLSADIIICTPEKWDGISRNWQNRSYVQKVGLLVIDEIHLLGADR